MKSPLIESIEYHSFSFLSKLARSLSYRTAGHVGAFLGAFVYRFLGVRKGVTLDNLARALPELSDQKRRAIALSAFKNYGTALVEMLWTGGQSADALRKTVRIVNPETINKYLGLPGGLILLSAHFGNWEHLPLGFRLHLDKPLTMIAQHQRNKRIDAMIDSARTRWGNRSVPMGISSREVFRALQNGEMVLILGDQSGPKESVFIDFFGRPSATHRGAAAFSLKTGAPIVMVLLARQTDGTYDALLEEVDRTGIEEYTEENIVELTKRHTAILERYVRMYPEQWLWMHKRWKHTEYYESTKLVAEGV